MPTLGKLKSMLTVIGEALVDIVHTPGDKPRAYPGGSPMNVAVGASRLGCPTRFVGHWGDDEHGHAITEHLSNSAVQVPYTPQATRTSTAQAYIQPDGAARYEFNIDWSLAHIAAELAQLVRESEAVHTGSIASMLDPGAATVATALRQASDSALITYDPNCRPSIVGDRDAAIARAEEFVSLAIVVKASDEDLSWLYPQRSLAATARAFLELGPELVVVTRGADGPVAYSRAYPEGIAVPAHRVQVADTVGAGDSLMAALITALIDRDISGAEARTRVAKLKAEDIADILHFSAAAAGITVSRSGANPPTRTELVAELQA